MKTLLLLASIMLGLTATAQSVGRTNIPPSVTLAWNASPSTSVAGYNLYFGPSSGNYTNMTQVAGSNTLQVTITNIVRGATNFYAVTAYDTNTPPLESLYSNEVTNTVPALPGPPPTLRITNVH